MAEGSDWVRWGTHALAVISGIAALVCAVLLWMVRNIPTPGDISAALVAHPTSKLSLGHIDDLTITSFAYLRWPLVVAAIAFLIGGLGNWRATGHRRADCGFYRRAGRFAG